MEKARAQDKTDCSASSDRNIGSRALLVEESKYACVYSTKENDDQFNTSRRDTSRFRLTAPSSPHVTLLQTPIRGSEKKNGSGCEMGFPFILNVHEVDQSAVKSKSYFESRWLSRRAAMKGIGKRRNSRQSERACCSYCRCCDGQGEGEGGGEGQKEVKGQEEREGERQDNVCVESNGIDAANYSKIRDGIVASNNSHNCQSSNTIDSSCVCVSGCGLCCRSILETDIFAQCEEIARGLDAQQCSILRISESFTARERQWLSEVRGREAEEGIFLRFTIIFFLMSVCLSISLSYVS
jgi:hypothetical protein